jgi:hypothetical protein
MVVETLVGSGKYTYEAQEDWAKIPEGMDMPAAAVTVDSQDRVYCFNRSKGQPIMVFDRDGNYLHHWGEGVFRFPHAIRADENDHLWTVDRDHNQMMLFTTDGKLLRTIGERGYRSDTGVPADDYTSASYKQVTHGGGPFNLPADIALTPSGDMFIADGYANARVHKFDPNGRLLLSWGECGADPGQFNIPHNIVSDPDGWVYVADRENHRVQIFDGNGKFETQWNNLHRPCGLYMEGGAHGCCYIGELGPHQPVNAKFPNLGPRISIMSRDGKLLSRVDEKSGLPPAQFSAPHGLCVDRHGDIYIGEVSWTAWQNYTNPGQPVPSTLRSLQKLVRVPQ